jgi:hypothetical protein
MEPLLFQKQVAYTKANGSAASVSIPLVDLPIGTLLFRGVTMPDLAKGDDARLFIREFLGMPVGGSHCLSPVTNVFFYPFPYVAFGADHVGVKFNAIEIYVVVKPLRIAAMVKPSDWIRGGAIKDFDGTAPIQRCDKFDFPCRVLNPEEKAKEDEAKTWDNCIRPEFAAAEGVAGWMAMADLDSLDVFSQKPKPPVTETSMGRYLRELEGRMPGKVSELLPLFMTDNRKHRGVPEIVLFPWSPHPGPQTVMTDAANELESADAIAEMADRFNYLPIACITQNGVVEAFEGDFKASNIGSTDKASPDVRAAIDGHQASFLERLMVDGIDIPRSGRCRMAYDSRTGFFVLDGLVPEDLGFGDVSYRSLIMPLSNAAQKQKALEVQVLFRSFFPAKHFQMERLVDGSSVRRSFIFERPPMLQQLYTDMRVAPSEFVKAKIRTAAGLFQRNSMSLRGRGSFRGGRLTRRTRRHVGALEGASEVGQGTQKFIHEYLGSTFKRMWSRR